MNNETLTNIFNKCYERFEFKRLIKEELFKAINEERWITIHPHGEDSEDYRRLKLEDGETPKQAIDRAYKKDNKKETSNDSQFIKYSKELNKLEDQTDFEKLDKFLTKVSDDFKDINIDSLSDKDLKDLLDFIKKTQNYSVHWQTREKLSKIQRDVQKKLNNKKDFAELKNSKEKIEYFKDLDVSKLSYEQLDKSQEYLESFLLENNDFDISERKALQKILFAITDQKERQGAVEKAKQIGGYTEKLQKLTNFSHFSDISSYPIELQKHIYDNYKKVYDKYPQLAKQGYGKLSKENIKSSTYANNLSIVNSVTLNSSWYDDLPKLEKSYANDVSSEWHPQGTNYNSIITHELGHGLLGYIQSNLGVSGKAIRSKVLKKLGLRIKDIDTHLSRYPNNSRDPVHEFFAEAFAEYMDSPNPRPLAVEFGKEIERIFRDLDRA